MTAIGLDALSEFRRHGCGPNLQRPHISAVPVLDDSAVVQGAGAGDLVASAVVAQVLTSRIDLERRLGAGRHEDERSQPSQSNFVWSNHATLQFFIDLRRAVAGVSV